VDSTGQAGIKRTDDAGKLKGVFLIFDPGSYKRLLNRAFLAIAISRRSIPRCGHYRLVVLDLPTLYLYKVA
jgi:hypothetical protein